MWCAYCRLSGTCGHPDHDHISGLVEVLKKYKVEKIIMTDIGAKTNTYKEFIKMIDEKNVMVQLVKSGDEVIVEDDIIIDVYWPEKSYGKGEVDNINNT